MPLQPIRFSALPMSLWRNGAGRKADIGSGPGWNVGFAWLDRDAPFSDYAGRDRTITLIEGAGFELDFDGKPPLRVADAHAPSPFDGGWPTFCRVLDGPSVVLNAMTARATHRHRVAIHEAAGALAFEPDGEATFLVVLRGTAAVSAADATVDLAARDAIRVAAPLTLRGSAGSRVYSVVIEPANP